jgi:hypothetical protein
MEASTSPEKTLTFEQLVELRENTEAISQFIHTQITEH